MPDPVTDTSSWSNPTFEDALDALDALSQPVQDKAYVNTDLNSTSIAGSNIYFLTLQGNATYEVNDATRKIIITVGGIETDSPAIRLAGDSKYITSSKFNTTKDSPEDGSTYTCVATLTCSTAVRNVRAVVFVYVDSYVGRLTFSSAKPSGLYTAELRNDEGDVVEDLVSGETATLAVLEKFNSEYPEQSGNVVVDISSNRDALTSKGLVISAMDVSAPTISTITVLIPEPSPSVTIKPGQISLNIPSSLKIYWANGGKTPVYYKHRLDLKVTVYPRNQQLKTVRIKDVFGIGAVTPSKRRVLPAAQYASFRVYFSGVGRIKATEVNPGAFDPTTETVYDSAGELLLPAKNNTITEYGIMTPNKVVLGEKMDVLGGYTPNSIEDVYNGSRPAFGKGRDTKAYITLTVPEKYLVKVGEKLARKENGSTIVVSKEASEKLKAGTAFRMGAFFDTHDRSLYPAIDISIDGDGKYLFGALDLNGGSAPSGQRYIGEMFPVEGIDTWLMPPAVLENLSVADSEFVNVNARNCNIRTCTLVEKRKDYDKSRGNHFIGCNLQNCVFDGADGEEIVGVALASESSVLASEFKNMYVETLLDNCIATQCFFHDSKVANVNFGGYNEGCVLDNMRGYDVVGKNVHESDLYVVYVYLGELPSFIPDGSSDNAILKNGSDVNQAFYENCDYEKFEAVNIWRPKGSEKMYVGYRFSVDTEKGTTHKEALKIPGAVLFYINRDYFGKPVYERLDDVSDERYLEIVNDICSFVETRIGDIFNFSNKWDTVLAYFNDMDSLSQKAREIRKQQYEERRAKIAEAAAAAAKAKQERDAELQAKWEAEQDAKIEKWIYVWGFGRKHCKGRKACEELKEEAQKSEIEYKKKKEAEAAAAAEREKRFTAWFKATTTNYGGTLRGFCMQRDTGLCMQAARAAFNLIDSHPGEYRVATVYPFYDQVTTTKNGIKLHTIGLSLYKKGAGECSRHRLDVKLEEYIRPGPCPDSLHLKEYYGQGSACTCLERYDAFKPVSATSILN